MENVLLYILKASALLAVFFLAYHMLLKKETFFSTNRLFLLAGIITAALLPLAEYTKVIIVDPKPLRQLTPEEINMLTAAVQQQAVQQPAFEINWFYIIIGVYALGLAFFGIRLMADVFKIRKMLSGKSVVKEEPFKLVDSPEIDAPFSFFNYIVYNSKALHPQELDNILTHEKVHSKQKHSLDMLLAQAFCIMFWFNPIAWLYKKAISQNLEFIADAEATKLVADVKSYQKTMLRLSVEPQHISITNHFYQSLIKKRIVMLNKQKSRRRNSWKYAIVLPALAAFMIAFQVKVVAQEKVVAENNSPAEKTKISLEVTKDSKDEELQAEKDIFKSEFDADVTINNVKRNSKSEITAIRVAIKAKGQDRVYEVSGTEAIAPFTIEVEKDDAGAVNISFGNGTINKPLKHHYTTANVAVDADSIYSTNTTRTAKTTSTQNGGALKVVNSNTSISMGEKMLVVVNGKKLGKGETFKLPDGEEIEDMTVLDNKEAKKKYGREAKDGAVEITTRRNVTTRVFAVPYAQGYAYQAPGHLDLSSIKGTVVLGPYEAPAMAFEEMNFGDLEELTEQLQAFKDMEGYDIDAIIANRLKIKESIEAARSAELARDDAGTHSENYKLKFFTQKMKQEMAQTRQEMAQARKEMEKVRKEMQAQRAQYRAEKAKSKKS